MVPGEIAAAVNMYTPSMPPGVGFGATTNGWRPSSVNTHPVALAAKGDRMPNTASRMSHLERGTVPLRVSHSATAAANAASAPNRIISRNAQYVTAMIGTYWIVVPAASP